MFITMLYMLLTYPESAELLSFDFSINIFNLKILLIVDD